MSTNADRVRSARWSGTLFGLVALALGMTVADYLFTISSSPVMILIALAIGGVAMIPLFARNRLGISGMMMAVVLYGVFAGWMVLLNRIDWTPRKTFMRASGQIRPGMTRAEVESVMSREFASRKPPAANWDRNAGHYILDPDDGAYNAETLTIKMSDGRVVSSDYSFD